jgi:hypothetical protein
MEKGIEPCMRYDRCAHMFFPAIFAAPFVLYLR